MARAEKQVRARKGRRARYEKPLVDLAKVPPNLLARGIAAVTDEWMGVLFIAQCADDRQWRVWVCFGERANVVSDLYATANECMPTYLARMNLIRDCAQYFYEAGRCSAIPRPCEPGGRPRLTLV